MSRLSKRFVLPYEPEYTAHRTDPRTGRAMQLHRLARQPVMSPSLVPDSCAGEFAARSSLIRHDHIREVQASGFPHKD